MLFIARGVIVLSALWLIGVSLFIVVRPRQALAGLARMASTNLINYTEITLRMIAGIALVTYAAESRFPVALSVAGWFVVGTSAILYLVPRRWHATYATYWAGRLNVLIVRLCAPVSLAAGLLLIYAVV